MFPRIGSEPGAQCVGLGRWRKEGGVGSGTGPWIRPGSSQCGGSGNVVVSHHGMPCLSTVRPLLLYPLAVRGVQLVACGVARQSVNRAFFGA